MASTSDEPLQEDCYNSRNTLPLLGMTAAGLASLILVLMKVLWV